MKKSTKVISLFLALALVFGSLSIGAFASESNVMQATDANVTETLPNGGIKPISELENHPDIEAIFFNAIENVSEDVKHQTETTAGFSSKYNYGSAFKKGADGSYITISATTSDTAKSNGTLDYYFVAKNAKGDGYANAKANFDEYAGRSFVVSVDIKLSENESWGSLDKLNLFTFTSSLRTDKGTTTLKTTLLQATPETQLIYNRINNIDTRTKVGTLSRERFVTVAAFVDPVSNTYDVYIDGVKLVEDAIFMTSANDIALCGRAEDAGNGSTANYIPQSARLLSSTKAISEKVLDFDNFKFYYADYYVECAHDFKESKEHTHDFENGLIYHHYKCEVCKCEVSLNDNLTYDAAGRCSACIENLNQNSYVAHDTATTSKLITAAGGEIVAAYDGAKHEKVQGADINQHFLTDSFGNAYVSAGKTTDVTSTNTYNQFFGGNEVDLSKLVNGTAKKGDFVIQFDIRFEEGYKAYAEANPKAYYNLMELCSYVNDGDGADTDNVAKITELVRNSSVRGSLIQLKNGEYIVGGKNLGKIKYGEYVTLSYHAHPETNSVDFYIDGVLVTSEIKLVPDGTNFNRIHFKYDTGKKDDQGNAILYETGPRDFVLGWVRLCSSPINSPDAYFFSYDNAYIYYTDEFADDYSKHTTDLTGIEAVENGYAVMTYSCDTCNHDYKVYAKAKVLNSDAVILAKQGYLGEEIGFKLYTEIKPELINTTGAKMVIEVGKERFEYALENAERTAYGYAFPVEFTSTRMADSINAFIETENGTSEVYNTSFAEYATELMNSTSDNALKALLKATLTYGAYAREYFAAYRGTTFLGTVEKFMDTEALLGANLTTTPELVNGSAKINPVSASLVLESTVKIRIFFTGEAQSVTLGENELEIENNGQYNVVTIEGIVPAALDNDYTVIFTDSEGEADTVTLSVIDCATLVVESAQMGEEFKNLARALYFYNEAAKAYAES